MYKHYGNLTTDWLHLAGDTLIQREPNMNLQHKWEYEDGLMLDGMYAIFEATHDKKYLDYIKQNIDQFVDQTGHIDNYDYEEFNLDHVNNGKIMLTLYEATGDEKYHLAAKQLYNQLLHQPKTAGGAFWHKKMYPYQIWLDGLYMASVFYGKYQNEFQQTDQLADVAHQFTEAYKRTLDPVTGLCYHAFDEQKVQPWANKETGCSPHFWTRSIGWFVMAMVDVLEYLPKDLPEKTEILQNLNHLIEALVKVADEKTNLWYQIPDEGDRPMNYLESSGSLMILTAIAKGMRLGYLAPSYQDFLAKGYQNALEQFISVTNEHYVNVNKIAHVGGLGGINHRDGSFAYYMSEPIVTNDHKGVGPFLLLICEIARRQ